MHKSMNVLIDYRYVCSHTRTGIDTCTSTIVTITLVRNTMAFAVAPLLYTGINIHGYYCGESTLFVHFLSVWLVLWFVCLLSWSFYSYRCLFHCFFHTTTTTSTTINNKSTTTSSSIIIYSSWENEKVKLINKSKLKRFNLELVL